VLIAGQSNSPKRDRIFKGIANGLAVLLTVGFLIVPVSVLAGLVD